MRKIGCIVIVLCILLSAVPVSAAPMGPTVAGKSALLMDAATGRVLLEQNPHEKLAPASVTKVMTMLLIMEAIDTGKISWNDTVTASEAAAAKGGSQVYLKVGETMSVTDMLKSIAVSSANDCACAMAEFIAGSEAAFVELMNRRAEELGMKDTHFVNCTGLDDSDDAKAHRTSAHDIAVMSRQLLKYHPDIKKFTTIWMDSVRDGAFGLSNTNKLIRFYDGATGLKTGFTSGAGYCLSASAARDGMELIAVVMGAEDSKVRFNACKTMLDHGFANYAVITPDLCDAGAVPVVLGKTASVQPRMAEAPEILIDKAQKGSVSTDIQLEPELPAPVSQGQRLGTMTVRSGEQILREIPLVAAEAVERLGFGDICKALLARCTMTQTI